MSGRPLRVEGRSGFSALVRRGRRVGNGVVTVHFLKAEDGDDNVRVAYSVSKRVGGAVVRNTWRRRLRAIAAEAVPSLHPGAYLLTLTPAVERLTFVELREQVSTTMRRASGASR